MIKQGNKNDILVIEQILLDAVTWLKKSKLENGWNENNIKWDNLSKDYKIEDFYIDYFNDKPAGVMALTDVDKKYWPQILQGDSLYLHKLAVKREFAGRGISNELIKFAKNYAQMKSIRLDCNFHRNKLRKLYEEEDFVYVEKKVNLDNCEMALYVWNKI